MTCSPRLALPFLTAGQAQKEMTHNEALQILDFVTVAAIWNRRAMIRPQAQVSGIATSSGRRRRAPG